MAGYMTKLQGYVFEGEAKNAAAGALENGMIVTRAGQEISLAADSNIVLKFIEKTTIYEGIDAVRMYVVDNPGGALFVENGFELDTDAEYDVSTYQIPVGAFVRAHVLLPGDEFVTTEYTGTPAATATVAVANTGKITFTAAG